MQSFRLRIVSLLSALLLVVLTLAITPATASAAENDYMFIAGITGPSTSRAGAIDILSLRQSWPATDKKKVCEIQVAKGLDQTDPLLWLAAVTNQNFEAIRIVVDKAVGTEQQIFFELRLSNVRISSIVTADAVNVPFIENITLAPATVTILYHPEMSDGTLGPAVTTTIPCI